MTTVEDLLIRIDASTESLRRELKRADQQVAASTGKMTGALKKLDRRFALLGTTAKRSMSALGLGTTLGAAGIVLMARAALRGTKNSIDFADSIVKTAAAAGLSTDALQEFRFAADKAGVSTESLDKAVKFLANRVGELKTRVSSELLTALKDYDTELLENIKNAKNQEEVFTLVVRALEKETDTTKQATLTKVAYGKAAGNLINLAKGQAGAFERDRKAARDLGAVLGGSLLKGAVASKDELTELDKQIEANTTRILINLSPALIGATSLFADLTAAIVAAGGAFSDAFAPSAENQLAVLQARLETLKAAAAAPAAPPGQLFASRAKGSRGRRGPFIGGVSGPGNPQRRPGTGGGGSQITIIEREIALLKRKIALKAKAEAPPAAPAPGAGSAAGLIPVRKDLERARELTDLTRAAAATLDETRTAVELYTARLAELDDQLAAGLIGQSDYNRALGQAKGRLADASGATERNNELLADAARVLDETRTETERYELEVARLLELLAAGVIGQETFNRALGQAKDRMADVGDETEALEIGFGALDDALRGNMNTFEDWASFAVRQIERVLDRLLDADSATSGGGGFLSKLFGGLFDSATGGLGAGVSPTGSDILGTPFAHGGRIAAGQVGIVGEKGPELFIPDRPGTIIPNAGGGGAAGRGGGVTNNFFVDNRGASVEAVIRLERIVDQVNASIEPRAINAVMAARGRGGAVTRSFGGV